MLDAVAQHKPMLRVDPALAEAAVFRFLSRGDSGVSAQRGDHRARIEPLYAISDPAEREVAFARVALDEFTGLGLAEPVMVAIAERGDIASRIRIALLGEARGRLDEGVTCDPDGEHLGIRIEAARFDDPAGLLGWARHALGHAEDTLDPDFGFVPGWEGSGADRVPAATQARLHRLWDISVDGRLAADGHLADSRLLRHLHRTAMERDLPGLEDAAIDAVVGHLWSGPRPGFRELVAWAARPAHLLRDVLPGLDAPLRPDRCPLCSFPSDDVAPPDELVAARVATDYPAWEPVDGLCARCTDRYRLVQRLGGAV